MVCTYGDLSVLLGNRLNMIRTDYHSNIIYQTRVDLLYGNRMEFILLVVEKVEGSNMSSFLDPNRQLEFS